MVCLRGEHDARWIFSRRLRVAAGCFHYCCVGRHRRRGQVRPLHLVTYVWRPERFTLQLVVLMMPLCVTIIKPRRSRRCHHDYLVSLCRTYSKQTYDKPECRGHACMNAYKGECTHTPICVHISRHHRPELCSFTLFFIKYVAFFISNNNMLFFK